MEENFIKMYGEILEVPSERVRVMLQDNEVLKFGSRELNFYIHKRTCKSPLRNSRLKTNSIFTGDSFGISYFGLEMEIVLFISIYDSD